MDLHQLNQKVLCDYWLEFLTQVSKNVYQDYSKEEPEADWLKWTDTGKIPRFASCSHDPWRELENQKVCTSAETRLEPMERHHKPEELAGAADRECPGASRLDCNSWRHTKATS